MAGDKNWQQKDTTQGTHEVQGLGNRHRSTVAQEKQDDNKTDTRTRRDQPNKSQVTTQA